MAAFPLPSFLTILVLLSFQQMAISQSVIQIRNHYQYSDTSFHCDSWRLSVETNNAGYWETLPSECYNFVVDYMSGKHYLSDSNVVASNSLAYAKTVNFTGNGKDVWVFDIDDTLLSTFPLHQANGGLGSTPLEALTDLVYDLPALSASLTFYNELLKMNFKIVILSERHEKYTSGTVQNLLNAGYTNWETLVLRNEKYNGKKIVEYKSEKRQELLNAGYTLHGNSGDQWSDLLGFAVAKRSFKVPNPMYHIA